MGRMRAWVAAVVGAAVSRAGVVGAAVLLAGCAFGTAGGRPVAESDDGRYEQLSLEAVTIWRAAGPDADGVTDSLAAEVAGTLVHDPACGTQLQADGERTPVVWPVGTVIAGTDPVAVEVPDGGRLVVGEEISGGGGYHTMRIGLTDDPRNAMVARPCTTTGQIALFNRVGAIRSGR